MSAIADRELLTIPESLRRAGRRGLEMTFLGADEAATAIPFAVIEAEASRVAAGLQSIGVSPRDRVALVLPDEREFVTAFFGIALAGAVAVPLAPPAGVRRLGSFLTLSRGLLAEARVHTLVTSPVLRSALGTLKDGPDGVREIKSVDALRGNGGTSTLPDAGLRDPALIQFTSGSTSLPKGVVLSHGNLAANCSVINVEGLRTSEEDRAVSWLPLFHDMGLIGFVLAPMYGLVPSALMSPMTFIRHPSAWLRALSRFGGTLTYAPNFAYAYAARRVHDRQLEGVDLSHVRIFGCGAEPIHAETLRRFASRFARYGVKESAFYPSYGMAESSLAISFARGLPVDRVRRSAIAEGGTAEPAPAESPDAIELVGCGRPFPGHELIIVDPGSGKPVAERVIGEIRIKGPSVTEGYFEAPYATARLFDGNGRLKTGDLGYLVDGQVFICGRIKDLIIVRGRNYYPQDIEWAAARVEGVRQGCVVAFCRRSESGRDELVVLAEKKPGHTNDEITGRIQFAVREAVGVRVDRVEPLPAGSIPKTSSGKLRRARAQQLFAEGRLAPAAQDTPIVTAGRMVGSQWAHLRHRLFGRRL